MAKISLAVGVGAFNAPPDVLVIQKLLNGHVGRLGLRPLVADGRCGVKTLTAIREFQTRIMMRPNASGRIDPGGDTLTRLSASLAASGPMLPGSVITITGKELPPPAAKVLKDILRAAGLSRAHVTSVARSAADQARIMYDEIVKHGLAYS